MTKFAKYLLYAGMGLAALVVFALSGQIGKFVGRTVGETTVENYQEGKQEAFLEKGQAMAAEEIRKQLPMRIDEITTLQSVLSAGKALIYNYRMSLKKSDLDTNKFIAEMKKTLVHNVCQQKQISFVKFLFSETKKQHLLKNNNIFLKTMKLGGIFGLSQVSNICF